MRWSLLACVVCCSLVGCVNNGNRPMGTISSRIEASPEPGEWCRVTLPESRSGTFTKSQITLTGRVEEINGAAITLSDVVVEGRNQQSVPVLGRMPYVRRMFTNTGVGVAAVGNRTLTPDEFERLEVISKAEARRSASQLMARNLVAAVIPGPL